MRKIKPFDYLRDEAGSLPPTRAEVTAAIYQASIALYAELSDLINLSGLPAPVAKNVIENFLKSECGGDDYLAMPHVLFSGEYSVGGDFDPSYKPTGNEHGQCHCSPATYDQPGETCDECVDEGVRLEQWQEAEAFLGEYGMQQYDDVYQEALAAWSRNQPKNDGFDPFGYEVGS